MKARSKMTWLNNRMMSFWIYEYCLSHGDIPRLRKRINYINVAYMYCLYIKDTADLRKVILDQDNKDDWFKFLYCKDVKDRPMFWRRISYPARCFDYCTDIKNRDYVSRKILKSNEISIHTKRSYIGRLGRTKDLKDYENVDG